MNQYLAADREIRKVEGAIDSKTLLLIKKNKLSGKLGKFSKVTISTEKMRSKLWNI